MSLRAETLFSERHWTSNVDESEESGCLHGFSIKVIFESACADRAEALLRCIGAPANTGDCTVELFCKVYEVPCSACMARVTDLRNASGDQVVTRGREATTARLKAQTKQGCCSRAFAIDVVNVGGC